MLDGAQQIDTEYRIAGASGDAAARRTRGRRERGYTRGKLNRQVTRATVLFPDMLPSNKPVTQEAA